ncbi:DNA circularization N-terminal domain-containing protein [Yoonia sp. SS1-5]|uniref:DNA circularization N-terminal domain-containing protein n=1 Tax=Yoonia rhodophyticola TaxID=3137370 RepID=A0AAN0NK55_9RHOB
MQETVLIGDLELDKVLDIEVSQSRKLAAHPIPGWDGDLIQDMGEAAAEITIRGIAHGEDAGQRLEDLRAAFGDGTPLDFVSSASVATEVEQTLLARLDVVQSGHLNGGYMYAMTLRRYVPPPEPTIGGFSADFLQDLGDLNVADALANTGAFADALGTAQGALDSVNAALDVLEDAKNFVEGALELEPLLSAMGTVASSAK